MPLQYRNLPTGRVVTVPEPHEVQAATDDPAHGKWLAMHQSRTIHKMDASTRWERLDDKPSETSSGTPQTAAPETPETHDDDTAEDAETSAETVDRPAQADPKASWVAWAVDAHGLSRDDAETMTKQELQQL